MFSYQTQTQNLPGYSKQYPIGIQRSLNQQSQQQEQISQKSFSHQQSNQKQLMDVISENFKVAVRVRPPLPREINDGKFLSTVQVSPDGKRICIYEYNNIELVDLDRIQDYLENQNNYQQHQFSFDQVYDQESSQEDVYTNTAKQAVLSTLQGFNATMIAYGQTGTGKTHTMEGFRYNGEDPERGIIPRATEEIFGYIENCVEAKTTFMVRASYLQIYNEVISDLLRNEKNSLHIREDKKKGVFVEGLSEWAVRSPNEIFKLMQKGALSRATAETKLNDISSRSHAIFIIIVEQMIALNPDADYLDGPKQIRVGKLNLVDLAGSERVRITGATGKRLEECKKINQSLSALGNVIAALTDTKQFHAHIPYRDSKITRILEDSLGGNCKTTFMAMISPSVDAFSESLSSLKFANRAKSIKNVPIINEDVDQKALLRKYEAELKKLKSELQERNKILVDKTRLLQLEEAKKKAEQDKFQAQQELEMRSKEFFQEREEKKKLEEKISAMNSQMLIGGQKIEQQLKNNNNQVSPQDVSRLLGEALDPQILSNLSSAIITQQKQLQQIYDSAQRKEEEKKQAEIQKQPSKQIQEEKKSSQQFDNDIEKYFQQRRQLQQNEEFNYQLSFEQDPNAEIPPELKELQYFLDVQSKEIVQYYISTGQQTKAKDLEMKLQKAQAARIQLEKISRLDFKKPSNQLSQIAKNYDLDLLDPQIQNELRKIQQQNIKDIRDLLEKLNKQKTNNYYINNTFITSNVQTNNNLIANISVDNSNDQPKNKKQNEEKKKKKNKNSKSEKINEEIINQKSEQNADEITLYWFIGIFILFCSVSIYLILK